MAALNLPPAPRRALLRAVEAAVAAMAPRSGAASPTLARPDGQHACGGDDDGDDICRDPVSLVPPAGPTRPRRRRSPHARTLSLCDMPGRALHATRPALAPPPHTQSPARAVIIWGVGRTGAPRAATRSCPSAAPGGPNRPDCALHAVGSAGTWATGHGK